MSMTESDFEIVEGWLREAMEYGEERHNEPYEKAIHALEEIQQYRAIGTVSEFRELKEKATAKKPNGIFFSREDGCRVGNCPSCGRYIKHREHKHCPRCGSLVDWSEGKE